MQHPQRGPDDLEDQFVNRKLMIWKKLFNEEYFCNVFLGSNSRVPMKRLSANV